MLENWFFWVYIFLDDKLWFLMWVFKWVVMRDKDKGVKVELDKLDCRVLFLSFCIVFLVIGFLFGFLIWLSLIDKWWWVKSWLLISVLNLDVGFVLMIVNGLFNGCILVRSCMIVFLRFRWCLFFMSFVNVKDVMYLWIMSISCCLCFSILVVKVEFIVFGGLDEFCLM